MALPARRLGAALALLALAASLAPGPPEPGGRAQPGGALVADLAALEALPGEPRVGEASSASAWVRNHGPEDARSFRVAFAWQNASSVARSLGDVGFPGNAANFTEARNASGGEDPSCLTLEGGLRRGCSARASITWTPTEPDAGEGLLLADALVAAPPYQDPRPANNRASNATFIALHRLALALEPRDNRSKEVAPGKAAFYRLTLRNEGNVVEDAFVAVASPQWDARLGANGLAEALPNASLRLAPGAAERFLVLLRAPEDPGRAPAADANVSARSSAAPALGNASLALPTTRADAALAPRYAFAAEAPREALVPAGGGARAPLRVLNSGTAEDAVHWRLLGAAPEGWQAKFAEEWLGVEQGQAAATSLVLAADASLPPGATAPLDLEAASVNGATAQRARVAARVPSPDLRLAGLALARDAVYEGDAVAVRVEVRNDGEAPLPRPVRLTLEARAGAQVVPVGEQVVAELGPGEARALLVTWDTRGLRGPVELAARLDPDAQVAESREDNNAASLEVLVRLHGLEALAPAPREARPGETLRYGAEDAFVVRNLGNAWERVVVALSTPRGWVNATRTLDLAPGASAGVELELRVPALPGTLVEELVAEASLANRSATRAEARSVVSIDDREPPVLERLEAPAFVELGTSAEFLAVLRDAVGVRAAALHLRLPDGALRVEPMAARGADAWVAVVVLARPGSVAYWVRAMDATPQNHTLDTSGAPRALLVGVRSAPLVELLEPRNGSAVRPGTLLRFRVTDIHGIASVQLRDGPLLLDLEEPYVVPTADWAEGLHSLEVVARNRFGNAARASFVIGIDATPPLVRDPRAEPPRPAPGQEFEVEARTSQDARLAAVQVLRDGRFVEEVPMDLGLGLASARLRIEEPGAYTLAVRAEDEAGNAASAELMLEVGAGVPGAGALAALAALALGAALRARRHSRQR